MAITPDEYEKQCTLLKNLKIRRDRARNELTELNKAIVGQSIIVDEMRRRF